MKVQILGKNCFEPSEAKAPSILQAGSIYDLTSDAAQQLIDEGKAVAFAPEGEEEDTRTPQEIRAAELKEMKMPELQAVLAALGVEDQKNNADRMDVIFKTEFTEDGTARSEEEIKAFVAEQANQ